MTALLCRSAGHPKAAIAFCKWYKPGYDSGGMSGISVRYVRLIMNYYQQLMHENQKMAGPKGFEPPT